MSGVSAITETGTTAPRRPALDHDAAMRLAADEFDRLAELLRSLAPDDWTRPTPCPAWDVHAMVCHILGSAEMFASPEEQRRQAEAALQRGGFFLDALTGLQVDKHRHRTPQELVAELARVAPESVRARTALPDAAREMDTGPKPVDAAGTQMEPWSLGYLVDVILTRDTWIHRSDICVATGRDMVLTPEHDGLLVADIAGEWAQRHGQPCTLVLTGPAGGSWRFGDGGPSHQHDAVEFCRIVSGRGEGEGLLGTKVPF
jgi:uncharacterized protein (TIGR03083 family)